MVIQNKRKFKYVNSLIPCIIYEAFVGDDEPNHFFVFSVKRNIMSGYLLQ